MSDTIPTPRTDKEVADMGELFTRHADFARQLEIELAELSAATEWRGIESAPKITGIRLLGYSYEWQIAIPITWSPHRPAPHWTHDNGAVCAPTHFMPLPTPPKI